MALPGAGIGRGGTGNQPTRQPTVPTPGVDPGNAGIPMGPLPLPPFDPLI